MILTGLASVVLVVEEEEERNSVEGETLEEREEKSVNFGLAPVGETNRQIETRKQDVPLRVSSATVLFDRVQSILPSSQLRSCIEPRVSGPVSLRKRATKQQTGCRGERE